jgi:hypothetical protein
MSLPLSASLTSLNENSCSQKSSSCVVLASNRYLLEEEITERFPQLLISEWSPHSISEDSSEISPDGIEIEIPVS